MTFDLIPSEGGKPETKPIDAWDQGQCGTGRVIKLSVLLKLAPDLGRENGVGLEQRTYQDHIPQESGHQECLLPSASASTFQMPMS